MAYLLPVIVLLVIFAPMAYTYWNNNFKRIPLSEFESKELDRIFGLPPAEVLTKVMNRGWMTNAEWIAMHHDKKIKR